MKHAKILLLLKIARKAKELRAFGDPGIMPVEEHRRWRDTQATLDTLLLEAGL